MRTFAAALLCITLLSPAFSQETHAERFPSHPMQSAFGLLFADNSGSSIFLRKGNETARVLASPGCGRYFSLSENGRLLGFKFIRDGLQAPAILDLQTQKTTLLHGFTKTSGQVSFTTDGASAFTIGESLLVVKGTQRTAHNLGTYCNLAPISPDGQYVAYNDSRDQIHIRSLKNNSDLTISDSRQGHYNPQWSPNGQRILYSSLGGELHVYDLSSHHSFNLGTFFHPVWSVDSRMIICEKRITDGRSLLSSDLLCISYDGSAELPLTNTPDVFEKEPVLSENGNTLAYSIAESNQIVISQFSMNQIGHEQSLRVQIDESEDSMILDGPENATMLDIPYVHQVYDTPDWFNGHWACAPTTAIMVIAYYHLLPPWDTWCSWPTGHHNDWGNYVSERYNFRQYAFALTANDPNSRLAQGGFGYMWNGTSSPYSTMAGYYQKHGLAATRVDQPDHSLTMSEVASEYPFTMCVGLTSAGHLVLVHGLGTEQHTVIVNDPYGNKNLPGYPNYSGKNARYDWPGYNNGYQNLNQIYWGITTRPPTVAGCDTVVDDLDFAHGFYLHNKTPGSMSFWRDLNRGYQNHMWWTYTSTSATDTCYATWRPTLHRAGQYEVFAYISVSNASFARYKIETLNGIRTVTINQRDYTNSWASLGTFNFDEGSQASVRLGNASDIAGQEMAFDAVSWVLRDTALAAIRNDSRLPIDFKLYQNYPNPFNPSTTLSYSIPLSAHVSVDVYDILGRHAANLVHEYQAAGTYSLTWDAQDVAAGIYVVRLTADRRTATQKVLLMK